MTNSKERNDKIIASLQAVTEIVSDNPAITHIFMEREDGVLVDIPLTGIEITIRNHYNWKVVRGAVSEVKRAPVVKEELPVITHKPDEQQHEEKPETGEEEPAQETVETPKPKSATKKKK